MIVILAIGAAFTVASALVWVLATTGSALVDVVRNALRGTETR